MTTSPKLLFVVTEDWFFVSHFLSVAVAARDAGFDVAVTLRIRSPDLAQRIAEAGIRTIPSSHRRGHFGPLALFGHVAAFAAMFRQERPDILHLVSIRLIVLGGVAALLAGCRRRVLAVTGLGMMGAAKGFKGSLARRLMAGLLRGPLGGRSVRYVFENREDPALLGLDPDGACVTIVGGAGVDPEREAEQPLPPLPPVKIAVVARMVHSKGIDVAVAALRLARARGAAVTLSLFGAPDPENPRAVPLTTLQAWSAEPGIAWAGHASDIRAVWRDHHVVCVPSRGGEGLPRALLEGAAAGRAVVTTLTPGCSTFARNGIEGYVVPPDDPERLADAFVALAQDSETLRRCAQAARARIFDGFTAEAVARSFVALYCAMLPEDAS